MNRLNYMNKKIFTITIMALLITASGCATKTSSKKTTKKNITSSTSIIIQKKPTTPKNLAEEFCRSKNYELIIRFDPQTKSGKAFCRFPNTEECEAENFMKGTCAPGNGSKPYLAPSIFQTASSTCTINDRPVCGADGRTYANHCSAEREGTLIKHTESCGSAPIISPADSIKLPTTTNNSAFNNKITVTAGPINETNKPKPIDPDWIKTLTDIITSQPPKKPAAFIARCDLGQTTYFQSDGCASCFNSLFNQNGEIICYPNNDITNSCPITFNKLGQNCTIIWRDTR